MFVPHDRRCRLGVDNRVGHARAKDDVQQVALTQLLVEKGLIGRLVDLRGAGKPALIQQLIKPGQRRRVAQHVVHIGNPIDAVGIKQHRDVSSADIAKRQIYGRFTGKNKVGCHLLCPSFRNELVLPCPAHRAAVRSLCYRMRSRRATYYRPPRVYSRSAPALSAKKRSRVGKIPILLLVESSRTHCLCGFLMRKQKTIIHSAGMASRKICHQLRLKTEK